MIATLLGERASASRHDRTTSRGAATAERRHSVGPLPRTVAECALAPGDPRREAVETRCDGIDNDCDGQIDVLQPIAANRCSTSERGVCAAGWAACRDGAMVCLSPAPVAETYDGTDEDCNGIVDDVVPAIRHARALLAVSPRNRSQFPGEISHEASVLRQWGVPFDESAPGIEPSEAIATLGNSYALVIVPFGLDEGASDPLRSAAIEQYVAHGGVLVVIRPAASTAPLEALGLRSITERHDATVIRIGPTAAPATRSLDSPEETELPLIDASVRTPPTEMLLDPELGTQVLAVARAGSVELGAVATRRIVGRGSIYVLGHDFHKFDTYRCYINCFEPAGDVLGLMLRDAFREGCNGHSVLLHTVPGPEDSVLLLTHDLDAREAENAGPWGEAVALQMAQMEAAHHVRGSYNVTTDYVEGYWNPNTIRALCRLGTCPVGGHSVVHLASPRSEPMGTCTESRATYEPHNVSETTLCGEVHVSLDLLQEATGQTPRAWRAPFLDVHPLLFDALERFGIIADSSYAIGDFKTALPMALAETGDFPHVFHHRRLYEFEISLEDGMGVVEHGEHRRIELQRDNFAQFFAEWTYALRRNADNRAITTLLVHPSWGRGVGPENVAVKIEAVARLIETAAAAGIRMDLGITEFADFWRARLDTSLDAHWEVDRGYMGTLTVGAEPVSNLTLEFGDEIRRFQCETCGATRVRGRRVSIATLAAGAHVSFNAIPDEPRLTRSR